MGFPIEDIIAYLKRSIPRGHIKRPGWRHWNIPAYRNAIDQFVGLGIAEHSWFGAWQISGAEPLPQPYMNAEDIAVIILDLAATVHDLGFLEVSERSGIQIHASEGIPAAVLTQNAHDLLEALGPIHANRWSKAGALAVRKVAPLEYLLVQETTILPTSREASSK
jgi:hypothetical protein